MFCFGTYNQILKFFMHIFYKKLYFYHFLKYKIDIVTNFYYPLEFDQNFKNPTKINLFN
jgi:hypothetical protein